MKKVIINLLIFILLVISADYICFKLVTFNHKRECISEGIEYDKNIHYIPDRKLNINIYNQFLEKKRFNPPVFPNDNSSGSLRPVILFGCSYVWMYQGVGFAEQLSAQMQRPVFNFAYAGWGAQHMLYLINNPLLPEIIFNEQINAGITKPAKPEYAVYTYIREHFDRVSILADYFYDTEPYLQYEFKNNQLQIKKYPFYIKLLIRFFSTRYIYLKFGRKSILSDEKKIDLLEKMIIESYHKIKAVYPDIKFAVLNYYQEGFSFSPSAGSLFYKEQNMFKNLEKAGITVISTKDLTDKNLADEDVISGENDPHPNPAAWTFLVKPLAEKLETL